MAKAPPAPPAVPPPPKPPTGHIGSLLAASLAGDVRAGHGPTAANTLDATENLGDPRGYIPWGNIALRRAVGVDFPLGRIVEVSGFEDVGKSTFLDQLLASAQKQPGIAALADIEKTRRRDHMVALGVIPENLIWVSGNTVEAMFEQWETIIRRQIHHNNVAWAEALTRANVKVGALPTTVYSVFDHHNTSKTRKPVAKWNLVGWSTSARAGLMQYQEREGLKVTGVRDRATCAKLRPCIVLAEPGSADHAEAVANWGGRVDDPRVQSADLPMVLGWDSVGGTATERELEGSARDVSPAAAAKVIRLNLRRLVQLIDDAAIGCFFVNQRYQNLNMAYEDRFKPSDESYGGGGLKFHTSVRIKAERRANIFASAAAKEAREPPIGHEVLLDVVKNKFGGSHRKATCGLIYGRGFVDAYALFADFVEAGVIRSSGGWYAFTDPTILGSLGTKDKSWQGGWAGLEDLMNETPGLEGKLKAIYLERG